MSEITPIPPELRDQLDRLKAAVQIMIKCAEEMEYTGNARFSYETYPTGFLNWLSGDFTLQGARKSGARMPPERQEEFRRRAIATVLGAPVATAKDADAAALIDQAIETLRAARESL